MKKLYPTIHNSKFKLRIKVVRNDGGKKTLGVSLRNTELDGYPRFFYFNNGKVSTLRMTTSKQSVGRPIEISLKEARYKVLEYLINGEYLNVNNKNSK